MQILRQARVTMVIREVAKALDDGRPIASHCPICGTLMQAESTTRWSPDLSIPVQETKIRCATPGCLMLATSCQGSASGGILSYPGLRGRLAYSPALWQRIDELGAKADHLLTRIESRRGRRS